MIFCAHFGLPLILLDVSIPASSQRYLLQLCVRMHDDERVVVLPKGSGPQPGSAAPVGSYFAGHPSHPHTRSGNADLRRGDRRTPQLVFGRDPSFWDPDSPGNDKPASRGVRQVLAYGGEILLRLQLEGYILHCAGDVVLTGLTYIVEPLPTTVGVQVWF